MQMRHAGREMLGKVVNVGGGDLSASRGRRAGNVGRIGSDEILGKVVQDGGETIVLVKTR